MKSVIFFLVLLYLNLLCFYGFISIFFDSGSERDAGFGNLIFVFDFFGKVFVLLFIIMSIALTMKSMIDFKRRNLLSLRKSVSLLKLGSIPFFTCNFILLFKLFSLIDPWGLGIILVFLHIIITYLILIVISINTSIYISSLKRDHIIPLKTCMIHIILQYFIVIDIISYLVLYYQYPQKKIEDYLLKNKGALLREGSAG